MRGLACGICAPQTEHFAETGILFSSYRICIIGVAIPLSVAPQTLELAAFSRHGAKVSEVYANLTQPQSCIQPGEEEIRSCLPNDSSRHLADILRQILQQLEEEEPDVDAHDPAFLQLKVIMLERIAALEERHAADPRAADLN